MQVDHAVASVSFFPNMVVVQKGETHPHWDSQRHEWKTEAVSQSTLAYERLNFENSGGGPGVASSEPIGFGRLAWFSERVAARLIVERENGVRGV